MTTSRYPFAPIGVIHSCFTEKFGIPRQPGLVPEARATLELLPPYACAEAVAGLADFSHLWVVFVFHQARREDWRPTVRPPRLGGNRRLGVFASRSPFRPNPLGLSAVRLEDIEYRAGRPLLHLSGVDLLDGTPVLDIKPYVPYSDAIPEARAGYAQAAPETVLPVDFSRPAETQLVAAERRHPGLRRLIVRLLAADPRPAYRQRDRDSRRFGMRLWELDVQWRVMDGRVEVLAIEETSD